MLYTTWCWVLVSRGDIVSTLWFLVPPPCVCVCAALDTTKDPCQKVRCSRHKVCVAQGYQRAMCVNRKKLENR